MTTRSLAVSLAALGALALLAAPAEAQPPPSGDWVVAGDEAYENQTFAVGGNLSVVGGGNLTLVNVSLDVMGNLTVGGGANLSMANLSAGVVGNVTVLGGGNLSLVNVVLEIDTPAGARRGIAVHGGGRLTTADLDGSAATPLDRTFIRPKQPADRLFFVAEPMAIISLSHTALTGAGYTQSPANHSGLYLDNAFVALSNLTVSQSFFGVVMLGNFANISLGDIVVHNNTYDGVLLQGATNVLFRGLIAADNGAAGLEAANGSVALRSASFLRNAEGLAVKFGATATAQAFDASGNQFGVVALTGASVYLSLGRVTNNTVNGVDIRLASRVYTTSVAFSDNTVHVYATGASTFDQTGGSLLRGVVGYHVRGASTLVVFNGTVTSPSGAGFDIDSSSADFSRVAFAGPALGGFVTAGTGFVFFDGSLTGSTVGGFLFTNSTGVIFVNPTFRDNRGSSLTMAGTSTGLVTGPLGASFVNTTAVLDDLNITGTLRVENSTLHAMRTRAWLVTGAFHGERGGIIGDAGSASLTLRGASLVNLTSFGVSDFTLAIDGDPGSSRVQGFSVFGAGVLEAANGTLFAWANVSAVAGGSVHVRSATLQLLGGAATELRVFAGSTLWLRDFQANVPGATYGTGAVIHETWSVTVRLEWAPGVPAPFQDVALSDATGATAATGATGPTGLWPAGYVRSRTGTQAGVATDNPYLVAAGSGSWAVTAGASFTAPTLVVMQLNDAAPPAVTITSPAPGTGTRADPVPVSGTAVEAESGLAELAWSYDNSTFSVVPPAANFTLPVAAPFEAAYTVTVRATDLAGNVGWGEVTFVVDRTPPTITLVSPANNSLTRGPTVDVAGRTEAGANLTVDGTAVPVDALGDFSRVLALGEGLHTLVLVAVDSAGNAVTVTVNVTLDSTPPSIVVEAPLNGTVLAVGQATLTGRVEPGASLAVDGLAYPVLPNGSFSAVAFLDTEGTNAFALRSVDAAGNENVVVWVLVRDTRAPAVSITGFAGAGPHLVNSTSPTFEITADEDAVLEASTGGGSNLATFTGTAALYHPVLLEGNTTLTVVATDAGGNTRTVVFDLRVDVSPPSYSLDPSSAAGLVRTSPWTLTVTTEAGAEVFVDGAAIAPTAPGGGTFAGQVALREGPNVVNLTVVDAAGNRRDVSLVLTLDTQAPSLTVSTPEDGARVAQDTVRVAGTAEAGALVTVGGSPAVVDAAGRFAVDYPLVRGENTVVVEATDPAGNTARVTRVVTREGGGGGGITGVDFIDDNLYFLLLLIALAAVGGALAARSRRKQRLLSDRATALSREIDTSVNLRGDLGAMDDFSPRRVNDPDFQSFEDFQRRQGGRPPGP